jgi:cell wall-associated NlpC family hydrolase
MRCAVEAAPIRAEPHDEAEQVTQALLYEPLRLEERHEGWVRVVTAYDYPGWMREWALEEGAGELPQLIEGQPLAVARMYLGSPYEWGGLTKRGIDCSGLVHIAHRLAGKLVPRDAWQQEEAGAQVSRDDARPGDLVSYGIGERADHIAFWFYEGRILHATAREGLGVVIEAEPPELQACRRKFVRLEDWFQDPSNGGA